MEFPRRGCLAFLLLAALAAFMLSLFIACGHGGRGWRVAPQLTPPEAVVPPGGTGLDEPANAGPLPGVFALDGRIEARRNVSQDDAVTSRGWEAYVNSAGKVGWYTSLAVVNGCPAISYYDVTNGVLKFAILY